MTNIQQMSHCVRHDSDCDRDLIWVACLKRRSRFKQATQIPQHTYTCHSECSLRNEESLNRITLT